MKTERTVAIVQARSSSKRLPNKVIQDIGGRPMLAWVVERARMARSIDEVVVATTTQPEDAAIEQLCAQRGYPCYRGSLQDVLDRFYQAAKLYQAETVVRFTADCPLLDPWLVDHTVAEFRRTGVDFAANRLPPPFARTYPIGLDTEVCTFAALERAWREASSPHEREHVMPYLYEEPGRFRILRVDNDVDYGRLRWTVDTPEDLELVRQIVARFDGRDDFTWLEVLALFEKEPRLAQINAQVQHKTYLDVDGSGSTPSR